MKNFFTLEQLSEGIRERHVGADRTRLVEKWSRTGLLRGLDGKKRENMAQLLENQAAQVLKESNAISTGAGALASGGTLQGFSNIAFPIVRRVFGGLVANELVSIQPMSLPNGLIFYLDYTYGNNVGGDAGVGLSASSANEVYTKGQSLYNNPAGKGVRSGSLAAGGQYDLVGTGYSKVHSGSANVTVNANQIGAWVGTTFVSGTTVSAATDFTGSNAQWVNYDPEVQAGLEAGTFDYCFAHLLVSALATAIPGGNVEDVSQIAITAFSTAGGSQAWGETFQAGTGVLNLRRLNKRGNFTAGVGFVADPLNGTHVQCVIRLSNGGSKPGPATTGTEAATVSMAIGDVVQAGDATGGSLVIPSFETDFGATPSAAIPEIDIKIETISITAATRKLRARWTPEMAQDLNAYHSIDAEVELTGILSEQIALEIDREILHDLVTQATGANLYWSRAPGKFVNKTTGAPVTLASSLSIGPAFTGTVQDWYQTLVETVIDVANTIHRKTLRGSANFIVTGPDVCTILEASVLYKPKYSLDGEGQVSSPFTVGAEAVGSLSNRFTVYKDPYFPRNRVLVGYKGGSYLETGYVYAPYVPLIVTPTLYRPEDFAPTKGVMTRYGKKMVRADFFGTVTVLDMNII